MTDRTRAHHEPAEALRPPEDIPLARDLTTCVVAFVARPSHPGG